MKLIMQNEQFFCLRNWALCAGSLQIVLTVSYAGDVPDVQQCIDLQGGDPVPAGLMLLLHPDTDSVGLLCLALDPTQQQPPVTGFRLHFESAGRPVAALHLEYAAADAMTAYTYRNIPWQNTPLTQTEILFRRQGTQLIADFSGGEETASVSCECASETEDIAGDIRADLRLLQCYSGSDAARIAAALEDLLVRLPSLEPLQAMQELTAQEEILTRLIERTQTEIHRYQEQLRNAT